MSALSPFISLYLPISPYISLYLPKPPPGGALAPSPNCHPVPNPNTNPTPNPNPKPEATQVAAADAMNCKLRAHAYHHPVLAGEWALSSGGRAPIQDFVDRQFGALELALGWFFWTLKTEHLNTPVGQPKP